jgi:hypothetical protein
MQQQKKPGFVPGTTIKWRYQKKVITSRSGQKITMYIKLFTMCWSRDILQLVAAQITDRKTWKSFALTSKLCAQVCRNIVSTQKQIILKHDPLPSKFRYSGYSSWDDFNAMYGGLFNMFMPYARPMSVYKLSDYKYNYKNLYPSSCSSTGDVWINGKITLTKIKPIKIKVKPAKMQQHSKQSKKSYKNSFNSGR